MASDEVIEEITLQNVHERLVRLESRVAALESTFLVHSHDAAGEVAVKLRDVGG